MILAALIKGMDFLDIQGPDNLEVTDLVLDSRIALPGSMFFALPGAHVQGSEFIDDAIRRGSQCIVLEGSIQSPAKGLCYIRVANVRAFMSAIADRFFGLPSASLFCIGITGTEGKSSVAYFVYQLLRLAGHSCGIISTTALDTGEGEISNPEHQTTPEAISVHRMLASMAEHALEFAIIESSSHGLSAKTSRLADVRFRGAVMTNVRHEHLEFHGTWEQYRSDKANLFRSLDKAAMAKWNTAISPFAVINADDSSAQYFAQSTQQNTLTYGIENHSCLLEAYNVDCDLDGSTFTLVDHRQSRESMEVKLGLSGAFNIPNLLAALLTCSSALATPVKDFLPFLPLVKPARGRMTRLNLGQPFEVVIDYAHTPSAFAAVLPLLRKQTAGRLICLFGSAGERDTEKRPMQGKVAAEYCDIIILTDEDPRSEDSMAILEEIAAGCEAFKKNDNLFLIPDRPKAIRHAFSMAGNGDLVVLLGKGHENSIIYKDHVMRFDEKSEVEKALIDLKLARTPQSSGNTGPQGSQQ